VKNHDSLPVSAFLLSEEPMFPVPQEQLCIYMRKSESVILLYGKVKGGEEFTSKFET